MWKNGEVNTLKSLHMNDKNITETAGPSMQGNIEGGICHSLLKKKKFNLPYDSKSCEIDLWMIILILE